MILNQIQEARFRWKTFEIFNDTKLFHRNYKPNHTTASRSAQICIQLNRIDLCLIKYQPNNIFFSTLFKSIQYPIDIFANLENY